MRHKCQTCLLSDFSREILRRILFTPKSQITKFGYRTNRKEAMKEKKLYI
jgi:hypothetical protein